MMLMAKPSSIERGLHMERSQMSRGSSSGPREMMPFGEWPHAICIERNRKVVCQELFASSGHPGHSVTT